MTFTGTDVETPLALPGCYLGSSNFLAAGDFVLLVFAEIGTFNRSILHILRSPYGLHHPVIVILTLIKGIQHGKRLHGPLQSPTYSSFNTQYAPWLA